MSSADGQSVALNLIQSNRGEPTKLNRLVSLLKNAPAAVFIQPHNVPDPDAIASYTGLRYLLGLNGRIIDAYIKERALKFVAGNN